MSSQCLGSLRSVLSDLGGRAVYQFRDLPFPERSDDSNPNDSSSILIDSSTSTVSHAELEIGTSVFVHPKRGKHQDQRWVRPLEPVSVVDGEAI